MGLNTPNFRSNRSSGFTLVEIMAVVLIILILAGLILSMAGHATKQADISNTKALLGRVSSGLENYKSQLGIYPYSKNSELVNTNVVTDANMNRVLYRTLTNQQHADYNKLPVVGLEPFVSWKPADLNPIEPYPWEWDGANKKMNSESGFADAWGNAVQYSFNPNISDTYRLWSKGPDGKSDDASQRTDDITPQ